MLKHQRWVPALLCATAAASGLAGGYAGTRLVTESQSSRETPNRDRALLSREQAFPPSENWPSHTLQTGRNVLFEDRPSSSERLPETRRPTRREPQNWSPPTTNARLNGPILEEPTSAATEPGVAIQSDVDLRGDDSSWNESPATAADEQSPNAASFTGTAEIDAFTDPSAAPATPATVDFGSGESAAGADIRELDQGTKITPSTDWTPPSDQRSEAIDGIRDESQETLL